MSSKKSYLSLNDLEQKHSDEVTKNSTQMLHLRMVAMYTNAV